MRIILFRYILTCFEKNLPSLIQRLQLQILLNTTAKGFGVKAIRIWPMSTAAALRAYADFTKDCMQKTSVPAKKLYRVSYRLGARLRQITGFRKSRDMERLIFYLYKGIGITMCGHIPGKITVSSCYFSSFYSPLQCKYISAMDQGIIAGICGGGKLTFTSRITEGCSCCRAAFHEKERNK